MRHKLNLALFSISAIIVLLFDFSCTSSSTSHVDKFYDTISEDFDYIQIPIIKPYKAASVDNGKTWLLEFDISNSAVVSKFGVARNFIYGYGDKIIMNGQYKKDHWFAFDVSSQLLTVYPTRQDLIAFLNEFNVLKFNVIDCNEYMDSLADKHDLSWYPKARKNYPLYPETNARKVVNIKVIEKATGKPDFYLDSVLPYSKNKVYYFKIIFNKKQNDIYYLLLPNRSPILIKHNLLIPTFIDTNKADLYLYTPVPVAEEKKIPEAKRFEKMKSLLIK